MTNQIFHSNPSDPCVELDSHADKPDPEESAECNELSHLLWMLHTGQAD